MRKAILLGLQKKLALVLQLQKGPEKRVQKGGASAIWKLATTDSYGLVDASLGLINQL